MNNKLPLISIVITTYKRTDRLAEAIESALNQSYVNKEILVIDDNPIGSIYRKNVEKMMINYPNVYYIKNSENLGGALSRNVGIDKSNGIFIAFLDDDDTFRKNKLEEQYNYYVNKKNKNIGLVYCYSSEVNEMGQEIGSFRENYEGNPIYEQMLGCIAGTSLWFCPKSVLIDVGKFEDSPNKQDSILLLKILAKGYEIYRVPEILVNYTEHDEGRISGLKPINIIGSNKYRELCRQNYTYLNKKKIKNIEYNFSRQLIPLYLVNYDKNKAFKELLVMIKIYPLKKTTIISAIKCLFPNIYLKSINFERV